jgi:hypothetical protein
MGGLAFRHNVFGACQNQHACYIIQLLARRLGAALVHADYSRFYAETRPIAATLGFILPGTYKQSAPIHLIYAITT